MRFMTGAVKWTSLVFHVSIVVFHVAISVWRPPNMYGLPSTYVSGKYMYIQWCIQDNTWNLDSGTVWLCTVHPSYLLVTNYTCNITWPTSSITMNTFIPGVTKQFVCTCLVFPKWSPKVGWLVTHYTTCTLLCTTIILLTFNTIRNITWPTSDVITESLCALFGVPKVIPNLGLIGLTYTTYTPLCTVYPLNLYL